MYTKTSDLFGKRAKMRPNLLGLMLPHCPIACFFGWSCYAKNVMFQDSWHPFPWWMQKSGRSQAGEHPACEKLFSISMFSCYVGFSGRKSDLDNKMHTPAFEHITQTWIWKNVFFLNIGVFLVTCDDDGWIGWHEFGPTSFDLRHPPTHLRWHRHLYLQRHTRLCRRVQHEILIFLSLWWMNLPQLKQQSSLGGLFSILFHQRLLGNICFQTELSS